MQNKLPFQNIGIAGIGLIGGSFAKSFARKGINIYGYDLNEDILVKAVESNIFQGVTNEKERFINMPLDLIYICMPVKASIEFINFLGKSGYKKAVTDSCSTKTTIIRKAVENKLYFCGGHPIKGKETSGFESAEDQLFDNAKHIITSLGFSELDNSITHLHKIINMDVINMSAEKHDEIFASVSHLPHLISFCLMDTVLDKNKDALVFAGGGFKDFTRIAASDASMWRDIFSDNKEALIYCVENLEKNIKLWKNMIKEDNLEEIYRKIQHISIERRMLK